MVFLLFLFCIAVIAACIVLNISLLYAFLVAIIFTFSFFLFRGYTANELFFMMYRAIIECRIIYFIIMLMGATISIWLASGIVPTMIYYGFTYIGGGNYILASFLISSIVAVVMGTALGTFSTIGMALYGIGRGLLIPSPVLIGAIVSGAFIADKLSPISSLTNLTISLLGVDYKKYLKEALKTFLPTFIICSFMYYIIGLNYSAPIDPVKLQGYKTSIENGFFISPALLFFPIIIVILALKGIKIIYNMTIGVFACTLICAIYQHMALYDIVRTLLFGYKCNSSLGELSLILKGGGIIPMFEVIFIVMGAIALSSLFEGTNIIAPIIDKLTTNLNEKGKLIAVTALISSFLTIVTCDQTVGILLPAKLLKEKYESLDIDASVLARTISDSGTVIAPLMAWNVNAIIITVITGISASSFAPYALLCYIAPIVTVFIGFYNKKEKQVDAPASL